MLSSVSAQGKGSYTAPAWANRYLGFGKTLPRPLSVSLDVLRDGALLESYDLLEEFSDRFPTEGSGNATQQQHSPNEPQKVSLDTTSATLKLVGAIRLGKDKGTGADILCAHESISKLHCVLQVGINPALCVPTWKTAAPAVPTISAAAMLFRGADHDEEEEETAEDLVSYVHLYDVGSSNGTFLIPGDGQKPQRLPPFRHFVLGNGALFRLGSSTRTYRVRWTLPLAGPVSISKVAVPQSGTASRKRKRSDGSTSSDDDDSDAHIGHIQISFSKKLDAKRELEEKGIQRMTQADLDALDDAGASILAGLLPDASLNRMSYAELQRLKEKISKELEGDGNQAELEQHRQLNLRKQLNAIEGALIRLRDASITL